VRASIVDYGAGNLYSLARAVTATGAEPVVTSDIATALKCNALILPGVGAFGSAMKVLEPHAPQIRAALHDGLPCLGICLGMQLLYEASAEDDASCLGVVPGRVERLVSVPGRPVPHMGWNQLRLGRGSELLAGIADGEHVYFVHGFAATPGSSALATCDYGVEFAAVIQHRNFYGTQFHPERSASAGRRLLANFLALPAWS